jgi:hypothetical protein
MISLFNLVYIINRCTPYLMGSKQSAAAPVATHGKASPPDASHPQIKIHVRAKPLYYTEEESGHIGAFTSASKAMEYTAIKFHDQVYKLTIPSAANIYEDYRITLWLFTLEHGDVTYTRRIGTCAFSISLVSGKPIDVPISDDFGVNVGAIRVGLSHISSSVTVHAGVDEKHVAMLSHSRSVIRRHIDAQRVADRELEYNHAGEVTPSAFRDILTPVGPLPMWSFPWWIWEHHRRDSFSHMGILESLLQMACYNMGLEYNNEAGYDITTMSELLSEVTSMIPRACYYTPDYSRREGKRREIIDEWSYLCHQSSLAYASYDCEDGSSSVIEVSSMLKHGYGGKSASPLLQRLHIHDNHYVTLFCIGTLRVPNTEEYIYHVYVMKLDRQWFLKQCGFISFTSHTPPLPAILIESTSYSSGCWEYKSKYTTEEIYERTRDKKQQPVEINAKIPSEIQFNRRCMYGHTQTVVCPEWVEYNYYQFDLLYKGNVGVPTPKLMAYSSDITMTCHYTDAATITAVKNMYQWLLPPIITPSPPPEKKVVHSSTIEKITIDGMVRFVDCTHDTVRDYAHRKGMATSLRQYTFDVVDGLKIVRLRC